MNYIQDIPQEMILERLKKLCSLGGIKPPQQGKEFIEFIQDGFARCEIETMDKAFREYLLGKYTIRQPQQLNVKFVSDIMNAYIKDNSHSITLKPREYMAIEAPVDNSPKMSAFDIAKSNWENVKTKRAAVFPSFLCKAWEELEDKPKIDEKRVSELVEMINDNQNIWFYKLKRERGHKQKRSQLDKEIIYKAACMAYYLEL